MQFIIIKTINEINKAAGAITQSPIEKTLINISVILLVEDSILRNKKFIKFNFLLIIYLFLIVIFVNYNFFHYKLKILKKHKLIYNY